MPTRSRLVPHRNLGCPICFYNILLSRVTGIARHNVGRLGQPNHMNKIIGAGKWSGHRCPTRIGKCVRFESNARHYASHKSGEGGSLPRFLLAELADLESRLCWRRRRNRRQNRNRDRGQETAILICHAQVEGCNARTRRNCDRALRSIRRRRQSSVHRVAG